MPELLAGAKGLYLGSSLKEQMGWSEGLGVCGGPRPVRPGSQGQPALQEMRQETGDCSE